MSKARAERFLFAGEGDDRFFARWRDGNTWYHCIPITLDEEELPFDTTYIHYLYDFSMELGEFPCRKRLAKKECAVCITNNDFKVHGDIEGNIYDKKVAGAFAQDTRIIFVVMRYKDEKGVWHLEGPKPLKMTYGQRNKLGARIAEYVEENSIPDDEYPDPFDVKKHGVWFKMNRTKKGKAAIAVEYSVDPIQESHVGSIVSEKTGITKEMVMEWIKVDIPKLRSNPEYKLALRVPTEEEAEEAAAAIKQWRKDRDKKRQSSEDDFNGGSTERKKGPGRPPKPPASEWEDDESKRAKESGPSDEWGEDEKAASETRKSKQQEESPESPNEEELNISAHLKRQREQASSMSEEGEKKRGSKKKPEEKSEEDWS